MTTRVLVVDDDVAIRRVVATGLTARGYEVLEAATTVDGLAAAAVDRPELIILDLGLPDGDGIEVCRRVREFSRVPIIVLSVETSDHRKIDALDAGADDFVTKPFSMPELLARMRAALRRVEQAADDPVLSLGDIHIDRAAHRVTVDDTEVELTDTEYRILLVLAENAGRVLTHDALLARVWGPGYDRERHYLRVYVNRLRRKLPFAPDSGHTLTTVPRAGYRLDIDHAND
jgi:two-component system, OmpR family, KDP operon response regulator KdpE